MKFGRVMCCDSAMRARGKFAKHDSPLMKVNWRDYPHALSSTHITNIRIYTLFNNGHLPAEFTPSEQSLFSEESRRDGRT